jgi:signal transduction histidine kinase
VRLSWPSWFRRPRRLLALFGAVTIVPALGLVWLGTTLIRQDQQLAEKQLLDRLERQAGEIASELIRDLALPPGPPGSMPGAADDGRAVALITRARDLNVAGRSDEALAVWAAMTDMDHVQVFGWPASLQAALARARALDAGGRTGERDREAESIRLDLRRGRWRIDAVTLEAAWAWVATPEVLASIWRARWREAGVAVHLIDGNNTPVVESGPLVPPTAVRHAADSGLPWTIRVASASPDADRAAFARRRGQLLRVLSLAAFLVLAGAYFVARGVRRELAAAELQSSFVSAVSHEFRTPLTSMSHLIELLRGRPSLDEARRARYYDALEQEAARLRRFVDQLLDFGKVDAGAARYTLEDTDPRPLIEDAVDRFRNGPSADGRAVTCHAAGALPDVAVDREALSRVLENMLENAAKYSPRGTPIDVTLESNPDLRLVTIRVRDHGTGIPAAEHEIIFDRFVRGSNARSSSVRGTGVGLALAREIVRAHRGDITVQSEVGSGSTFSVVLPATGRCRNS